MKTKIYLYCLATGQGTGAVHGSTIGGDVVGCALCEDGEGLASHYSSSVDFAKHDMGLTSNWKHDIYKAHCPDGYELEWIDEKDLDNHEGYKKAYEINQKANKCNPL